MSENGDDIVEEEPQEMEVVEEAEVEDGNRVSSDSGRFVTPFFTFFRSQKVFKFFFKFCFSGESEEEEYEVERIVATRLVKKKPQYLVKWVNYDEQVIYRKLHFSDKKMKVLEKRPRSLERLLRSRTAQKEPSKQS